MLKSLSSISLISVLGTLLSSVPSFAMEPEAIREACRYKGQYGGEVVEIYKDHYEFLTDENLEDLRKNKALKKITIGAASENVNLHGFHPNYKKYICIYPCLGGKENLKEVIIHPNWDLLAVLNESFNLESEFAQLKKKNAEKDETEWKNYVKDSKKWEEFKTRQTSFESYLNDNSEKFFQCSIFQPFYFLKNVEKLIVRDLVGDDVLVKYFYDHVINNPKVLPNLKIFKLTNSCNWSTPSFDKTTEEGNY